MSGVVFDVCSVRRGGGRARAMRAVETRRTKARHVEYAMAPGYRGDMGAIGGLCSSRQYEGG